MAVRLTTALLKIKGPHITTGWYSIYLPVKDGRLSWPSWMVTYWHGLPDPPTEGYASKY